MVTTSFGVTRKAPAGTVSVPGLTNIFLDKVEVTNKAWRDYLLTLKRDGGAESEKFLAALPDTGIWKLAYNEVFFKPHPYDEYPIVGISYEQAREYCRWRSELISGKEKRRITFSLPSVKVYKMVNDAADMNKIAEGLYSTKLGFRTFLGLCDNAAEMTAIEGEAIQGSDREQCVELYEYYLPSHKLGFRCMAELR